MNFYLFMLLAAALTMVTAWRGLALQSTSISPGAAIVALAWFYYAAARMLAVGTVDSAWWSYAASGTLLATLSLVNPGLHLSRRGATIWEIGFLFIVATYVVAWLASGRQRFSAFVDPNTESILLITLSAPIWAKYSRTVPLYLWAIYAAIILATFSRSAVLFIALLVVVTNAPQIVIQRRFVAAFSLSVVAFTLSLVMATIDPSLMPTAVGPLRLISLNDGSFFERRDLLFAALEATLASPTAALFGSPVKDFVDANGNVVHNGFADLLLTSGLLGGGLFLALLGIFVARVVNRKSAPLFVAYVFVSAYAVLAYNSTMFLTFVLAMVLLAEREEREPGSLGATKSFGGDGRA